MWSVRSHHNGGQSAPSARVSGKRSAKQHVFSEKSLHPSQWHQLQGAPFCKIQASACPRHSHICIGDTLNQTVPSSSSYMRGSASENILFGTRACPDWATFVSSHVSLLGDATVCARLSIKKKFWSRPILPFCLWRFCSYAFDRNHNCLSGQAASYGLKLFPRLKRVFLKAKRRYWQSPAKTHHHTLMGCHHSPQRRQHIML